MINKTALKRIFISVFLVAALGCEDDEKKLQEYQQELDSLSNELTEQKEFSDSLNTLLQKGEMASGFTIFYGRSFRYY